MPTYEELQAEKLQDPEVKKALEMFRALMGGATSAAQRGTPTQDIDTSALTLSPEQIKEYQGRLTTNLNKRDQLRDYLMSFLERESLDPSGDPNAANLRTRLTPDILANEMKKRDREGKSKIGNIFRNIDYALGDGRGRDLGIAKGQQQLAVQALQDILKDSGTEIRNTVRDQAGLAQNLLRLTQTGAATQGNLAAKQAQVKQNAINSAHRNTMLGIQGNDILSMNPFKQELMKSRTDLNKHQLDFAPFGRGGTKEMQDAQIIMKLREKGKNEQADELERQLKEKKAMNYMMQMASKGGFGTTREQIIPGQDAKGNVTYTKALASSQVNNPWRDKVEAMLAPSGKATSTVKYASAPIEETLTNAAKNATTPQKVSRIVNKAVGNAASANQKQHIATQAIMEGLTPEQIRNDAAKAKAGQRYVIEDAAIAPGVTNTGMKKPGPQITKTKEMEAADRKINTSARFMIDAASSGVLNKAFGPQNRKLTAFKNLAEGTLPDWFSKKISPGGDDPSHTIDRILPDWSNAKDPEVRQFYNEYKSLILSSRSATTLKETGKALNESEIRQIMERLPQPSDTPEVALEKMVTFALTERVESYFADKNYDSEQIKKISGYVGDYISPRVKEISQKTKDALLGKIPRDSIKYNFRHIDPEDVLGESLYTYAKKNGMSLKDLEYSTGLRIRRLIPDDDTQGSRNFTAPKSLIDSLKNPLGLKRRGAAK